MKSILFEELTQTAFSLVVHMLFIRIVWQNIAEPSKVLGGQKNAQIAMHLHTFDSSHIVFSLLLFIRMHSSCIVFSLLLFITMHNFNKCAAK